MSNYYANKMDNLEEMDKFLERYKFPRMNQEETENTNRAIVSTEIESVILKLSTNRSSGPDGLRRILSNIYRRFNTYPSETISKKIPEEGSMRPLSP